MRQISPGRLLDRLPFRRWKTPWQRSPASLANTAIPQSLVSPMTFLLLTSSIRSTMAGGANTPLMTALQ